MRAHVPLCLREPQPRGEVARIELQRLQQLVSGRVIEAGGKKDESNLDSPFRREGVQIRGPFQKA